MDPDIVRAKLESLARCVARIESKTPSSASGLAEDIDAQDVIALNLERAVQLCVDIGIHILLDYRVQSPSSMAEIFGIMEKQGLLPSAVAARMAKAVGFRNLAVHEYSSMDWGIVFTIITTRLGDFRAYAKAVMALIR